MLKRVMSFALAVLMIGTCLTACKKSGDDGSEYSVIWQDGDTDGDGTNNESGDNASGSTSSNKSSSKKTSSKKGSTTTTTVVNSNGTSGNSSSGKTSSTSSSTPPGGTTTWDFKGESVTIMREWEKYTNGTNTAWDNFNKMVAKAAKKFNVKIVEKKQKTDLAGEMLAGVKPEGQLYLTRGAFSYAQKGYAATLDSAMKATGITQTEDIYSPVNVAAGCWNGKHYNIGLGFARVESGAILYNKKMTEKAGYVDTMTKRESIQSLINDKKWTWAKMTEVAKKCTIRNASGEVTQWGIAILGDASVSAMIQSNGGYMAHPNSSGVVTSGLNDARAVEALQQVYNWFNVDKVAKYNASGVWTQTGTDFADKKVAMVFTGHSEVSQAWRKLTQDDYGVAYIPMGPKCNHYIAQLTSEYCYVIPAAYQNQTTQLLLLANEMHKWPDVNGKQYTRDDEFRDEWGARYFHSNEQYTMWKNLHYGTLSKNNVKQVWDMGTDGCSVGLSELYSGKMTAAVWAQTNYNSAKTKLADTYGDWKYTGKF